MAFSNPRFLLFLGLLLVLLQVLPGNTTKKRGLALASCLFYATWDWRYLGLLLLVSVIDYVASWRIYESSSPRVRRLWLWTSLGSNLGILAYFKYANFFLENTSGFFGMFGAQVPALNV